MIALLLLSLVPALLPAGHGWRTRTARVETGGCPRCVQWDSWAATVPFLDPPDEFPHRTMAHMRAHDVVIEVMRSWEPDPPAWVRQRRPLRIVRSQIYTSFEGNTTHGRVSRWMGATWRAGSFVSVAVIFGSAVPAANDVARAQRELDAARYAPWRLD